MKPIIFLFAFHFIFFVGAQTYTVESVPNPKTKNNSLVSNPDKILSDSSVLVINSMLSSLEQQTGAQIAVVAVQSIGDEDIFDFAQKLFNHWGIGQAKDDNGLLILLVLDIRTVRLHTGFGLEGDLPDIVTKHIEVRKMVPRFKGGDYDGGILEGVREVVSILGNVGYGDSLRTDLYASEETGQTDNESSEPLNISNFLMWTASIWSLIMILTFFYNRSKGVFTNSPKYQKTEVPNIHTSSFHFLIWFLVLPVGIFIGMMYVNKLWVFIASFYGYLILGAVETRVRLQAVYKAWMNKKEYHALHQLYQEKLSFWKGVAFMFPIPFAFMFGQYKKKMQFLRDHPRDCADCKQPCTKLSEQTEDPFLSDKQKFEEGIKSVDYDVWKCGACKAAQVFRYPSPKTKFEECPKCETIAYYVSKTITLRSATKSREGLKEETRICKFCHFKNIRTFVIPKITESTSGSSGGGGGGSFGGGSSGGGGSSSSW